MSQKFALSESAVAVLRLRAKGLRLPVTDRRLEAYCELACQQQRNTEPLSQSHVSHSAIGRSQLWLSERPSLPSCWHV